MKNGMKKLLLTHPALLLKRECGMLDVVAMIHATIKIHKTLKGVKANG